MHRYAATVLARDSRTEFVIFAALDGGDFAAASDLQVALTTYDWDENSTWIVRHELPLLLSCANASVLTAACTGCD